MNKRHHVFKNIIFIVYCIFLIWILFSMREARASIISFEAIRERISSSVNIVPFDTINSYLRAYENGTISRTVVYANLIGNILLFFPMGVMLPHYMKKPRIFPFIFLILIMTILVEAVQLITGLGSLDIDDVILNLSGAVIGYLTWSIHEIFSK